jgi:hypothetical protein
LSQQGLFDTIVGCFRQVLEALPDKRTGKNTRYGMEDAALSAKARVLHPNPVISGLAAHDGGEQRIQQCPKPVWSPSDTKRQSHPGFARPGETGTSFSCV